MQQTAKASADAKDVVEPRSYFSMLLIMLLLELMGVTYLKSAPLVAACLLAVSAAVGILLLVADGPRRPSGAARMRALLDEIEDRRAAGEKFTFCYGQPERSNSRR
jgi:hypothetical protein